MILPAPDEVTDFVENRLSFFWDKAKPVFYYGYIPALLAIGIRSIDRTQGMHWVSIFIPWM